MSAGFLYLFCWDVFSVGKKICFLVVSFSARVGSLTSLPWEDFLQPVWGDVRVQLIIFVSTKCRKGTLWVIFFEICHLCIDDQGFRFFSDLFYKMSKIYERNPKSQFASASRQFYFLFSAGNGCFVLGSILFVIDARPQSVKTPIETRSTEI